MFRSNVLRWCSLRFFSLGFFLFIFHVTGCSSENNHQNATVIFSKADDSPTSTADNTTNTQPTGKLPTGIDVNRLKDMLQTLASEEMKGRLLGSPAGVKAQNYAIQRMIATGMEVQGQEITFPLYDLGSPIDLSIVDDQNQPLQRLDYIKQYREVGFSGSGSVTGTLLFVGYGTEQSYQDIDVTEKVVAILTSPPDQKSETLLDEKIHLAAQNGAVGIIFIPSGIEAMVDSQQAVQYQPTALHDYATLEPSLLAKDVPVVMAHVGVEEMLLGKKTDELTANPSPFDSGKRVHLEVQGTIYTEATCMNLFAILPGTDPVLKNEVIAVGAHYDHIGIGGNGQPFPGAADNASGAATVLEAAMQFGKAGIAPKRTLMFALWCAEEQGLYGSMAYIRQPIYPLENTRLYVNVDYIGDTIGPFLLRGNQVSIQDDFITASANNAIQEINMEFQCASDECPFFMMGVPFIRFLSMGDHHHVQTDTFENVNLTNVEQVANAIVQGLINVGY
jgi:hypothetical protein